MNYNESVLKSEEKIAFLLRSLYRSYGYQQFKMSKFEAYDLYVRNKDFLISDGIITFTVADAQMATEIVDRGLIFRGQAYTLTKITLTKGGSTGLNTILTNKNSNVTYNLLGQKVKTWHGLIIKNGKKYIVK